jgi:hypothetical protein
MFDFKTNPMFKRLFILLFLTLFLQTGFAQRNLSNTTRQTQTTGILKVDDYLSTLSSSATSRGTTVNPELARVISLMDDVQSSIYLMDNTVNVYGTNPQCIYADVNTIGLLANSNLDVSAVEMVHIKINSPNDFNTVIDLNYLSNLPSIRFIYLVVSFDCTELQIADYIGTNYNSNCKIVYKIDKGA